MKNKQTKQSRNSN